MGVIKVDGANYRFMGKDNLDMEILVPTSEMEEREGRYTTTRPANNWTAENFDAAAWKTAERRQKHDCRLVL